MHVCFGCLIGYNDVSGSVQVVVMAYLWLEAGQSLQQIALLTNTGVLYNAVSLPLPVHTIASVSSAQKLDSRPRFAH